MTPGGVAGLDFMDEAETVNALVPELKRAGAAAIVVLIHEGGFAGGGPNQAYVCRIGGRIVSSAGAYGRFVAEIGLRLASDGASASAVNHVVRSDLPSAAAQTRLIARYAEQAPELSRVVGRIAAAIPRSSIRAASARRSCCATRVR